MVTICALIYGIVTQILVWINKVKIPWYATWGPLLIMVAIDIIAASIIINTIPYVLEQIQVAGLL